MKRLSFILNIFFACALLLGCAKSSDETQNVDLRFKEEELLLDAQAGIAALTIIWSNTEWEISTPTDGFLSGFNFLKGGSFTHSNQTRVQFNFSENNTNSERVQTIQLKNVLTSEITQIAVKQSPKPPIVLEVKSSTTYQQITGFGGMLNPALWQGGNQLTNAEIERLYGANGLGSKLQ
jgi:glucuronoarabinoxylan endo-1,4-beta-xylanase